MDKRTLAIVTVAALGYFVDIYDLTLFSVIRISSLQGIGITDPNLLLEKGAALINWQMFGMLIGGVLWGVLGDKKGRLSVLFGSIAMYSLANIANGFVTNFESYATIRFIAGIGLAGELGAGITLVSEVMTKENRGYGTMIVATIGLLGAVVAAQVGDHFSWQTAYFIGGGLGLMLLILRVGVVESGMYGKVAEDKKVSKGNFLMLFTNKKRLKKYLACILIGVPIWFVVAILITFSPEFSKAIGISESVPASTSIMYCYIGLALGDFLSALISQLIKNRKKVVLAFLLLTFAFVLIYLYSGFTSVAYFKTICLFLGIATGYWAVFVTIASEQFGTNIRATVTTTVPNFVRGSVPLLTGGFLFFKNYFEGSQGNALIISAVIIGSISIVIALAALFYIEESYGKNLDYIEED